MTKRPSQIASGNFKNKDLTNILTKIYDVPAVFEVKMKNDHRSKFSNLSNWKEEA